MRGQIFKIAIAIAFIFLLWLQSLFTETEHVIRGDVHIFKYNLVPWLFLVLMSLTLVGFAEMARRFLKDRVVAVICLLGIPVFDFISLQFICERVEVSKDLLVHRREPPHTRFNVDIPWNSIQATTKIEREKAGLFAPNFYNVGYEFTLRNGQLQELPSNTILTRAQDEIDRMLAARQIPVNKRVIPIGQ
jgi:hypothetical protein